MLKSKITNLGNNLAAADSRLGYLEGQRETLTVQLRENNLRLKDIIVEEDTFLKAGSLLQSVSEKTRDASITKIEGIVTSALQEILDNPAIEFKVIFENKRNAVSVEFRIRDNLVGTDIDIVQGEAGGLKNVISTILRLVIIDLHSPAITGPIVLDEVGANISVEYQPRFGKFLKDYSRMIGRQIILVSHSTSVMIEADKEIRLSQVGGVSKVV
jgi:DNA repair ATPase RecN